MLKVAHPWIKNRNIVEGGTIFSFDSKGVAQVKDLGNARVDLERLLKKPKFFIPEEKTNEVAAAPVSPPGVLTSAPVVPESEEPKATVSSRYSAAEGKAKKEEAAEEKVVTKRTPAKKNTGGK